MKSLFTSLLSLFLLTGLVACAEHSFTEMQKAGSIKNGDDPDPISGPKILWVQVPNGSLSVDDKVTVVYQVLEGSSPVVSIECKVDGAPVSCNINGDTLVFNGGKVGGHKFSVAVADENNLKDSGDVDWVLHEKFQKVKDPLVIADADDQVDVIVVIDNSGSMRDEQTKMAEKMSTFLDKVKGLDWRVGIITTDWASNEYGKGKLLKFEDGSYFLSSKLDINKAKEYFGKVIQRKEKGDANEQGIRSTLTALQRAFNPKETIDQEHKKFFRKDAALAVIVISDENESGSADFNKGETLVNYIDSKFGNDKMFKFHSIIVRPGDEQCRMTSSLEHFFGTAYADLTKTTGGVLGNICDVDYGNQLSVIGQDTANTQNTFQLDCVPKDLNGDGIADVKVTTSGSAVVPNFVINGDKIVFSSAPKAGNYSIEYFCPKK